MARITTADAGGVNRVAFLDAIAVSEIGTAILRRTDDGYNVLVGSTPSKIMTFASYSSHPNAFNSATNSTAAGRYQILARYWPHYQAQLHLPDFGPVSQDRYALQQLREQRALPLIDAGNFAAAVKACANIWASLPGAGYGQHENTVASLQVAYQVAGGRVTI